MQTTKIQDLISNTQTINRAKGWYDKPKSEKQLLALIVTEIAEAIEEVRTGRPPLYFVLNSECFPAALRVEAFTDATGKMYKPEGELSELSDVAIRCFDVAGRNNVTFNLMDADSRLSQLEIDLNEPLDFYYELISMTTCPRVTLQEKLSNIVMALLRYCELKKGYDLMAAVELKLAYNNTREIRHGGKLY